MVSSGTRVSSVANQVNKWAKDGSWIRKMFIEGDALKKKVGAENVFDFTLGNPSINPPPVVQKHLKLLTENPGMHGYMSNDGYEFVRANLAAKISEGQRLPLPLTADHMVMSCGAGGALNVIFTAILNPGEEVIVPAPYFVEYNFYIGYRLGKLVPVATTKDFQLDVEGIKNAITPQTKAVLINSPNNPTGAVYSEQDLIALAKMLAEKEQEYGHDILLIADEPYADLVYDGTKTPSILKIFPHSLVATSYSKNLALPGERIGYIAINPAISEAKALHDAFTFCTRTLGFVNAPALAQRLVAEIPYGEVVGLEEYTARRDLLYKIMTDLGCKVVKPKGAFYMFPESPTPDDLAFKDAAFKLNLLAVPGRGFGLPGYLRLAYAIIGQEQIKRSGDPFEILAKQYGLINVTEV